MKKLELTPEQLSSFLKESVKDNLTLIEAGKNPVCFNIEGPAGIGKTAIVKQLAKELGLQFVSVNLGQLDSLDSLVGFPLEKHLVEIDRNGQKENIWIPKNLLDLYIAKGARYLHNTALEYAPPAYVSTMQEGGGILFLDDYTRALPHFMQATMQIIQDRAYYNWQLPKGWMVMLSTNPDGAEYSVASLDTAQKTRFITVNAKFDADSWINWAESAGIDYRCITFVEQNKHLFSPNNVAESGISNDSTLNARTMEMFFNSITAQSDWQANIARISILGKGSVGDQFLHTFISFINDKFDKLPSPEDVICNLKLSEITTIFDAEIKKVSDNNHKKAVASVVASRLVTWLLYTPFNVTSKEVDKFKEVLLSDFFSRDTQTYCISRLTRSEEIKRSPRRQVLSQIIMDPRMSSILAVSR